MTAEDIIAAADATRQAIEALDQKLAARIQAIEDAAFDANRDFTAAQSAERDQLRAARHEAAEARRALGFVTLEQLNTSETVRDLQSGIDAANQGLSHDLDRLKAIADFATEAAKVADGLVQIATSVAALVK